MGTHTKYQVLVVYMPLSNTVMERLMYHLRIRYGNKFISARKMSEAKETFKDTQYLLCLVADQSPGKPDNAYWVNFFDRPTAFVPGPEKETAPQNVCGAEKLCL